MGRSGGQGFGAGRCTDAIGRSRPGGGGDGRHDLSAGRDELGAIEHDAYVLFGRLQKDGDIARESSDKAATTLKNANFTLGDELDLTVEVWNSQLKTLLQSCTHISDHLDYSAKSYAEQDKEIEARMRHRDGSAMSVSEIERYYK